MVWKQLRQQVNYRSVGSSVVRLVLIVGTLAVLSLSACTSVSEVAPAPTEEPGQNADQSTPNRLEIPVIGADMPVVELGWHRIPSNDNTIISEWDVAEYAAGWHKNSARPGESGNIVMSGHNNILGSVFRKLDLVRAGDEAMIWMDGERYVYEVEQVLIVPEKTASPEQRAENSKLIGEFEDERLTLVSCWPRNNNTHRIIVVASPAGNSQNVVSGVDTTQAVNP